MQDLRDLGVVYEQHCYEANRTGVPGQGHD